MTCCIWLDDALVRGDRRVVWITFMGNLLVVLLCADVTGLNRIVVVIRSGTALSAAECFLAVACTVSVMEVFVCQ